MPPFVFGEFDGPKLQATREKQGLTRAQLAEKIGTHSSTVGLWEGRGVTPAVNFLPKIAAAVGLDVFDLYAPEEKLSELAKLRVRAGLSQRRLAQLVRAPQSTLSDWERGLSPIPEEKFPLLADAFGVSVAEVEAAAGSVEKVKPPARKPKHAFTIFPPEAKKAPWRISVGDGEPVSLVELGLDPDATLRAVFEKLRAEH